MTATVSGPTTSVPRITSGSAMLSGFGGLIRKDFMDWRRGRRTWVVFAVSSLFMWLLAINAWLQVAFTPPDGPAVIPEAALDPMLNVVTAVSGQVFLIAAVFAVIALLTGERESGTLAWTASKPVSRRSIWLAKFASATAVLCAAAALVPLVTTAAVVGVLYGPPSILGTMFVGLGMCLAIALYVATALTAATIFASQAAVAAVALGAMFLSQVVALVVPAAWLPTSILDWSIAVATGQPAGVVTLGIWAVSLAALIAFSVRRMERLEL